MITITDLIEVISLCDTFYILFYVRGKNDDKKEKAAANHLSKIKLLLAIFVLFVLLSVWLFYSLIR